MPRPDPPVRWAARVRPDRVRRLYLTDARGIVDPELIDDVGFALYARCQSILTVTQAAVGQVACPRCTSTIARRGAAADENDEMLACATCGWRTTWGAYHRTWQHQELYGGGAVEAFSVFVEEWPKVSSPQRKMLLIDQLIHRWHWQAREDRRLGRPAGVNLIEGSRAQVLALLDELTYGPASTAGTQETRDGWREAWRQVRAASRGHAHAQTDREGEDLPMQSTSPLPRCDWGDASPLMLRYHDEEWGVPVHDDTRLCEFLLLEGAQAGLSWSTILNKRDGYRAAFDGFDPQAIARYDEQRYDMLLHDARIVRNGLKIRAAIHNARAFVAVQQQHGSFDSYIWQFVGGRPVQHAWNSMGEIPAKTPESDAMSAALKRLGFSFVGSTICYAFMQAVGMVNDHIVACYRRNELASLATAR